MAIKKITLRNFQIHKNLVVEPHENVTVLVGPSNKGKSAIIRALNWVVFNRPAGDVFRRWESKETSVSIELSDGVVITRKKSDKDNLYQLTKAGETQDYRAFGQKVPEPISEALLLAPINFQHQMDPAFLVSDSSAEIARKLNEVANLDLIDTCLQNINSAYREANRQLQQNRTSLETSQAQLKKLAWIDEAEIAINELAGMAERQEAMNKEINELGKAISRLEAIDAKLPGLAANLSKLQGAESAVKALEQVMGTLDALKAEKTALVTIINEIKRTNKSAVELKETHRILSEKYNRSMPETCPLCEQPIEKGR